MIKKFLVFIASFVFLSTLAIQTVRADTSNFTIESFDAQYHLSKDNKNVSSVAIKETIIATQNLQK